MLATRDIFEAQLVVFLLVGILVIAYTAVRLLVEKQRRIAWGNDNNLALAMLLCQVGSLALSITDFAGKHIKVSTYYASITLVLAEIWLARLSHLWIRGRGSRGAHGIFAAFFLILWVALTSQIFWVCEQPSTISWKTADSLRCPLGITAGLTQGLTNILADIILIYFSFRMLQGASAQAREWWYLRVIALTPALTAVLSVVHAVFIVLKSGQYERVFAQFLSAGAVTACNSQIIVSYLLKIRSPYELAESNSARQRGSRTGAELN